MAVAREFRELGELERRKLVLAATTGAVLPDDVDWATGRGRYACGNCEQPLTDEELRWYGVEWDGEMICEGCIAFPTGVLTARIARRNASDLAEQFRNYCDGF